MVAASRILEENSFDGKTTQESDGVRTTTDVADVPTDRCTKRSDGAVRYATAEVFTFLTAFGQAVQLVTFQTLLAHKICLRDFPLQEDRCRDLQINATEKDEVLRRANNYYLLYVLLSTVPAAVVTLFFGPWSDKYGRKPVMMLSVLGEFLTTVGILLNVAFFEAPVELLSLSGVAAGLLGGEATIRTSAYAHATENSEASARTLKFFLLRICFLVARPLGTVAGGQLYRAFDYFAVFAVSAASYLLVLAWVVLAVSNSKTAEKWRTAAADLISFGNIKANVKACFGKREGNGRRLLVTYFASVWMTVLCVRGNDAIEYYYINRLFDWDTTYFSNVVTVLRLATNLACVGATVMLIQWAECSDAKLGMLAATSLVARTCFTAFIKEPWMYVAAYFFGTMGGSLPAILNSGLSKLAGKQELGKIFAYTSFIRSMAPFLATTLATQIFNGSLNLLPGLPYLVFAAMYVGPLLLFLQAWQTERSRTEQLEDEPEPSDPNEVRGLPKRDYGTMSQTAAEVTG